MPAAGASSARGHFPTEQARSLDPSGRGNAQWAIRWKPALSAGTLDLEQSLRVTPWSALMGDLKALLGPGCLGS